MKIYFASATDYLAEEQIKAFRKYDHARAWLRELWKEYEANTKAEDSDFKLNTNIQVWDVYSTSSCDIITHHG